MANLQEALPYEFSLEFTDTPAWKLRDVEVIREVDGRDERWPGNHKYVFNWYVLADGHIVGWNENPSKGWSFPVMRVSE